MEKTYELFTIYKNRKQKMKNEIIERVKETIMQFGDGETEFNTRDINYLLNLIESPIQNAEVREWISVEDELPKKEGGCFSYRVLILDQFNDADVCCYDYELNRWTLPLYRIVKSWKYIKINAK